MDNLGCCLEDVNNKRKGCVSVKEWIGSIEGGQSPDKLTTLDLTDLLTVKLEAWELRSKMSSTPLEPFPYLSSET